MNCRIENFTRPRVPNHLLVRDSNYWEGIPLRHFFAGIRWLTNASKWIGLLTLIFSMLFITFAALSRSLLDLPILGDVEIVQLSMVVLIMFGLAYSETMGAHISIGFLVDRLPPRVQTFFDIFSYILAVLVCMLISWHFVLSGLDNLLGNNRSSNLLRIPFYPLKFIIAFGYFLWGLETLRKLYLSVNRLFTNFKSNDVSPTNPTGGGVAL